jgi:hypothetical protein
MVLWPRFCQLRRLWSPRLLLWGLVCLHGDGAGLSSDDGRGKVERRGHPRVLYIGDGVSTRGTPSSTNSATKWKVTTKFITDFILYQFCLLRVEVLQTESNSGRDRVRVNGKLRFARRTRTGQSWSGSAHAGEGAATVSTGGLVRSTLSWFQQGNTAMPVWAEAKQAEASWAKQARKWVGWGKEKERKVEVGWLGIWPKRGFNYFLIPFFFPSLHQI